MATALAGVGCGGGSNSSSSTTIQAFNSSGAPLFTIVGHGGDSTDGDAGDGGCFEFEECEGGTDILLLTTGRVNADFALPATNNLFFGSNPLTISTDTTLRAPVVADSSFSTVLGDDATNPATGLLVEAGVTLTLQPNAADDDAGGLLQSVRITFGEGSILIEGDVTVEGRDSAAPQDGLSDNAANLLLQGGENFVSGSEASIAATGSSTAGAGLGNGGDVIIEVDGTIVARGTIDTRGASGDTGGNGGSIN
ncbi:MAG: hypothetical protein ACYS22_06600, partial [Planctomycetota bacterium]